MSVSIAMVSAVRTNPPLITDLMRNNALGIELEYEQMDSTEAWKTEYWVAAPDGSLRNRGIELVSRPLAFPDVAAAIDDAETIVLESGAIASARCGIHTHMNMRPYSMGQVWSLAALYAIIEPTLYQTYALGREDSMFAVPMWRNTSQVNYLYRDITALRVLRSGASMPGCLALQSSKYSALNFTSLLQFGTLEMRQPYCTTDFEAIRSWVEFCMRLVDIGTSFEDPNEVLTYYESASLDEVQERMFGMTIVVNPDRQEQAEDAACLVAGITEPEWADLNWHITEETHDDVWDSRIHHEGR